MAKLTLGENSMLCEMCGKDVPFLKPVLVEGTRLQVCGSCARFGAAPGSPEAEKEVPVVESRLERREKRYKEKDVFSREVMDLVDDYSSKIRKAREGRGWNQEDLARKLNEKKSIVAKLESGSLHPSELLTKKLEHLLDITLLEKRQEVELQFKQGGGGSKKGMTLGDFIKIEKK